MPFTQPANLPVVAEFTNLTAKLNNASTSFQALKLE